MVQTEGADMDILKLRDMQKNACGRYVLHVHQIIEGDRIGLLWLIFKQLLWVMALIFYDMS